MVIHRILGLCYLELYLLLMAQMVPRMFDYQVEFSTRTVAHLMLGVSIGLLLIVSSRSFVSSNTSPASSRIWAATCCGARRWS